MAAILLTGDVMIGRGIDQILRNPSSPELYEPFVRSANIYVALAENRSGRIPRAASDDYVWGDALDPLRGADLTIVNLETAATRSSEPEPDKGIHYRFHPANVGVLTEAGIDCCVLSNNHVLDWREEGLLETLSTLEAAGLPHAGAGRDSAEAHSPAVLKNPEGGRVLVYGLASTSSGVPPSWAAAPGKPGVGFLTNFSDAFARSLGARIAAEKGSGDLAILSIHWGPNWGYDVPGPHRQFAHRLIDEGGVDIVHGHSSHHPMALELYGDKPVFYGCGDFLNDYEGISGHEEYRPNLVLAYRVMLGTHGGPAAVELLPFRVERFRLNHASREEAEWLNARLDRECRRFGGRVTLDGDGPFTLRMRQQQGP